MTFKSFRIRPKFKFRNPFKNPVQLTTLHNRLFGKGKVKKRLTWRGVGKMSLYALGGFVLLVVFLFAWFAKDLPTPGKIRNLTAEGSTRLYDRNMQPLYTISGEKKRITVEGKEIPDTVKQATIALEDRDFYHHPGVDPRGILRAALTGKGGGSTITQQFVKNSLLTNEVTYTRKIKEAILAIELEILYSKDEILTMYLNYIPYGGNNYGIEAAAKSYFGKSAKDLTLAEAATLAALPQAPSTLSPYGTHQDRLIARRDYALEIMAESGNITRAQADEAKATKLAVAPRRESITAPHFVLYVKEWLVSYFEKELGDKQLAEQKVESGGLTVVTTLDLEKQKIGEQVLGDAKGKLGGMGASNAALVSVDPKRGDIITMVGSVDYFQEQFGAFNVATAARQPGSSFKPIVYATAFKEKYNPGYYLFDLKTDFGNYTPQNYDGRFRGPLSIRQALGNSLNIPAVKTLGLVGVDKALKTASDMGISTLTDKDRYGLSLVLGGGEVTPLEMAGAYGTFANNGNYIPTSPILKITDQKGKEIINREEPKDGRQVLDAQVAYEITSILSDTNAKKPTFNFSMKYLTLADRPVASKTGTTNGYRDAWTIGYTPQYATAVWVGNNDNTAMTAAGGSIAAAPLWHDYMAAIHKDLPVEQFVRPEGIQEIEVDRLSNKLPVAGSDVIKDIFASWQVPKEKDDVHVQVRVCKENGLLAGETIPDQLAEMRTYVNIHSEKPDNPNWEGPVQAWAAANGQTNRPPTQQCVLNDTTKPSISITSLTEGQSLSGEFTISANASAPSGVQAVDFLIDDTIIATDTDQPFQTVYNTNKLSGGAHTISVTVRSNSGSTATVKISVNVSNDTTPPGNVTAFNGSAIAGGAALSWVNPEDADFKSVKIYVYVNSTGAFVKMTEVLKPGMTLSVTGLTSGTAYRFVAKSVDDNGNESSGVTIFLTPL